MCGDFLKKRRAQRLGVYRCFMNKVIKMFYKTEHKETQPKQQMSQSPSKKWPFKSHDVPTARGLLWFRENRVWNKTAQMSIRHIFSFSILAPLGRFWYHLSCLRQVPAPGPRKVRVRAVTCFRRGCCRSCAGFLRNRIRKNMAGEETNYEKYV